MILLTILLLILGIVGFALIGTVLTGGLAFLGVFGDLIIFIVIIVLIVKLIRRKKNK